MGSYHKELKASRGLSDEDEEGDSIVTFNDDPEKPASPTERENEDEGLDDHLEFA